MTADERDLTPEEEAELTRLLHEAGGPVPAPPEVVARLDDVLAGLVAERAAAGSADADPDAGSVAGVAAAPAGDAPVVSLEARRRRRWPKALLGAAAVVVGGYAVTAALTGTMSGDVDSAVTADESTAGGAESAGSESADSGAGGDAGGQATERSPGRELIGRAPANATMLRERPPLVRSDRLAGDVSRVLREADRASERSATMMADEAVPRAASTCVPIGLGPDDAWYLVRYDGRRAALVTAAPEDGTVRATVVACDGEPLAEVTVPTP